MTRIIVKVLLALLAAAALAVFALGRGAPDELLEPEQAFLMSARPFGTSHIEVRFAIADGYYMYRDRFKFETDAGKLIADVELPPGIAKKDPFFGDTQTYRREALIRVPFDGQDAQRGTTRLKVTSQGCADTGVCYVPLEQVVDVRLDGAGATVPPQRKVSLSEWLERGWVLALLGAIALAAFLLSLRLAPAVAPLRTALRRTPWFYPATSFAFASLAVLAAAPLLAASLQKLAWGAVLVMGAVWLRATDALPERASGTARLAKGIGVLALAGGVMLLAFAAGWRSPQLGQSAPAAPAQYEVPHFERVANLQEFEARLRASTKPTMLDFYADWCVSCKEMERFTFSDAAVRERMARMQLLQVDVTRNTDSDKAFLKRFGIFGPPGIMFFDASGNELRDLRVIGFQKADPFTRILDRALRAAERNDR